MGRGNDISLEETRAPTRGDLLDSLIEQSSFSGQDKNYSFRYSPRGVDTPPEERGGDITVDVRGRKELFAALKQNEKSLQAIANLEELGLQDRNQKAMGAISDPALYSQALERVDALLAEIDIALGREKRPFARYRLGKARNRLRQDRSSLYSVWLEVRALRVAEQ